MSNNFGMPGPGGSMGQCAVCGDTFIADVVKDLMGMDSGIESFTVGFVDGMLYCHAPKCKDAIRDAFAAPDCLMGAATEMDRNRAVRDALPDGPLKKCIIKAMENMK